PLLLLPSLPLHFHHSLSSRVVAMALRPLTQAISDCPKTARILELAWKYRAVANNFRFEPIQPHHMPDLMSLSKGFFEDQTLTSATGSSIENCSKGMEYVFAYSIAAQSVVNKNEICYENATNKPIGFRLVNPAYRNPKMAPFSVPTPTLAKGEISLFSPLDETWAKIWDRFPTEDVIMKGELIYVNREHRKKGIVSVWLDYDMHFPTMAEQSGANIYACLSTERSTKGYYTRHGYTESISSPLHVVNTSGLPAPLPQGDIRVFTTDMRTSMAMNVKPVWDWMKAGN
ncbi:hypothetical protein PMAYCL1PPCAC_28180, partial [Pristionchus mayeri]